MLCINICLMFFNGSSAMLTQHCAVHCLTCTTSSNPVDGNPPFSVSPDRSAIAWAKWNHTSTKHSSASSPHYCHNPTNYFSVLDLKSKYIAVIVTRKIQSHSAGSSASICTHTRVTGHEILPYGLDSWSPKLCCLKAEMAHLASVRAGRKIRFCEVNGGRGCARSQSFRSRTT